MLSSAAVSMRPACSRSFNLKAVSHNNTTQIYQIRQHHVIPRLLRCHGARGSSGGSSGSSGSSSGAESSAWQQRLYSEQQLADAINVAVTKRQRTSRATGSDSREKQGGPDSTTPRPADRGLNSSDAGRTQGPSDFVVIKKAASSPGGSYIPTTTEMQVQEEELDGSRYWDAAIQEFDDEDDEDDEFGDLDDDWEDEELSDAEADRTSDDDGDDEVGEVVSLLRELAAGLEEEDEDSWEADQNADGSSSSSSSQSSNVGMAGVPVQHDNTVPWRRTYLGSAQPPLVMGPVCLKSSAGKGRGVFTTAAVPAGEVLLVAAPLALLYSEEGTTPENEELAEHLIAKADAAASNQNENTSISVKGLAPWQQHALLQLRVAGDSSELQVQQDVSVLRQLMGPSDENSRGSDSGSGSSSSHDTAEQQQHALLPPSQLPYPEQLTQLVFANCTGEEFEDQALVLLRASTSCGHLGIWPAAALINHSCAPNCHAMLLGERLVIRAARDIPASTELTLSYLGPQLYAPAAVRQAELKQQWQFDCGCSRCKAEARYAGFTASSSAKDSSKDTSTSTSLAAVLKEVYERCQELAPDLDAAVEAEDLYAIRGVQQELLQMQSAVEGGIRAQKPPANVRRWLQACMYDLYDLASLAADQLPAAPSKHSKGGRSSSRRGGRKGGRSSDSSRNAPTVETEALASCVRIIGELTPGSSAHVELATEYMVRTEARFGSEHQEAVDAASLCAAAITTRYAPINSSMLQLLMDTWAGAALL